MNWFTVERIDQETYAFSEYAHWEKTHSYLLLGQERALLIDTGLGVGDLYREVRTRSALPVQAVLTHAHWDHMGALASFPNFALHGAEESWLTNGFPLPPSVVRAQLTKEPCAFPPDFSPETYQVFQGSPARLLEDRDLLELGGRTLQVFHTPGHSPGHVCYYEPERGYLFSGDLIYEGCMDAFYPSTDPAAFLRSIERMAQLKVRRILPGHHALTLSPTLREEMQRELKRLANQGKLQHGRGLFSFGTWAIHL